MFGISGEHLLILGIVLLIFGPRRLPELGHTMGKAIRNFKDAISGVEEAKFRRLQQEAQQSTSPNNEKVAPSAVQTPIPPLATTTLSPTNPAVSAPTAPSENES